MSHRADFAARYERLRAAMPSGRLLISEAQLAGYSADGLGYKHFRPDAVAIPGSAVEVARLVGVLKRESVPYVVRGAGTSLSGGPVAAQGGIVIHLSGLKHIEPIDPDAGWIVVESGVIRDQLSSALQLHGLYYPPDPSSGPVCTLGGNVACNAGGVHCFRYGVTSNYVLGVEVILPDGSIERFGGPAGGRGGWRDDWKRLFVGSEGTLGIFTRFWLRVIPLPEKVWTFRATFRSIEQASLAICRLASHSAAPSAIELMDPRCVDLVENSPMAVGLPRGTFMLLTEIDGPAALVDQRCEIIADLLRDCGSTDVLFSDKLDERLALWKARKVAGGLLGQVSPDFLVQDAVIPRVHLARVLQFIYDQADHAGISVVNVFHAGDGNLHPNFLFDSRRPAESQAVETISSNLMHLVIELNGTLSGEHGIGNDKSMYMEKFLGVTGQAVHLALPRIFNPYHQLNPLKIFPERRFG